MFPWWAVADSPAGLSLAVWSPPLHAPPAGKRGQEWGARSNSSAAASSGRPPGRKHIDKKKKGKLISSSVCFSSSIQLLQHSCWCSIHRITKPVITADCITVSALFYWETSFEDNAEIRDRITRISLNSLLTKAVHTFWKLSEKDG